MNRRAGPHSHARRRARHDMNRREFLQAAAGAGAALVLSGCAPTLVSDGGLSAAAAILRARYDQQLADVIEEGFRLVPPPDVRGKRVLLKVNLVDLPREGRPIVTDPAVIVAAAEAFQRRGAAEVVVGD
ncbi:MAG TPA: twin-arginine translocation signal domain-containing protein, partial [Phycisphaerae bacterium]|nr:twin-arginine translocation signal domain-containing protein [Phycisphaerae bacterium]